MAERMIFMSHKYISFGRGTPVLDGELRKKLELRFPGILPRKSIFDEPKVWHYGPSLRVLGPKVVTNEI